MLSYYDSVLAGIPLLLGAGTLGGIAFEPVSLQMSIGFTALIATFIVGHALFVRGPTSDYAKTSSEKASGRIQNSSQSTQSTQSAHSAQQPHTQSAD